MKRSDLFPIMVLALLMLGPVSAFSVKHTILVSNFAFTPSSLSGVNAGDTVRWEWVSGNHTTTSTTIPAGASTWDQLINSVSTFYEYVPTVGGVYNYKCTPHASMGMIGDFTVTAAAPLTVMATSDPSSICDGGNSMLHAVASGGTGSYTYSWVSNPPGFTSNQANVQVSPSVTTTYTVTVTSGGQNASSSTMVAVQAPPMAIAGMDTLYCDDIGFFSVLGEASNYSSVMWTTTGDGTFANGNTLMDTYTPGAGDLTAGMVNLIFRAMPKAPCMGMAADTVEVTFESCAGIRNQQRNSVTLRAFPNPSSGQFTVQTGALGEAGVLTVIDMKGQVVYEQRLSASATDQSFSLNVPGLVPGIYQVNLSAGKSGGMTRILIR